MLIALHSLHNLVGSRSRYAQLVTNLIHRLMVERVDKHTVAVVYLLKQRVLLHEHGVCRLLAVGILRVLHPYLGIGQVLLYMSVEGNGESLHATAYTKYRYLSVIGISCKHQFGQVALAIDVVQAGYRLVAVPEGVEVGAARKQQGVYMVECGHYYVVVVYWRDEHRRASRLHYLPVVGRAQSGVDTLIVGRYAHNRTVGDAWSLAVKLVEVFV